MKQSVRMIALVLCCCLLLSACSGDKITEKLLTAIAENEGIQSWLAEHDLKSMTADAAEGLKNAYPVLKEFLAREDVKEKLETVGLPLIERFLQYTGESMKLKAETLADVIRIFAPELTAKVDALFQKYAAGK